MSLNCANCGKSFEPRFDYQTAPSPAGEAGPWCSPGCVPEVSGELQCTVCDQSFSPEYVWQAQGGQAFCSEACRQGEGSAAAILAVMNQKGGTGKTTTAIHVAAGFAERGDRVLLVDADAQGNVGASLQIKGPGTLKDLMLDGKDLADLTVTARPQLDLLTSDASIAVIDLHLPSMRGRARLLQRSLAPFLGRYDRVVIDCGPSLSLLNQNALCAADGLLIPVSCDYLALVGVRQVMRTIANVQDLLNHPVEVVGVIPTLYDPRRRIDRQVRATLQERFADRLGPVVRQSVRITEAPGQGGTVFDTAPSSRGAQDYRRLVDWLAGRQWRTP